jgi:hypothetical protein
MLESSAASTTLHKLTGFMGLFTVRDQSTSYKNPFSAAMSDGELLVPIEFAEVHHEIEILRPRTGFALWRPRCGSQ